MSVLFEELFATTDHYELAGEVQWTRSNRHTGIRHLPLRMNRIDRTPNRRTPHEPA